MMPKTAWLPLSPGDTIQMIAPGMAFDRVQLKAGEKILSQWGVELFYPRKILGRHPVSSNGRKARIQFFKEALQSDSKIIWGARGGYGSIHLVEELQKIKAPKTPKLLIGFSDLCTLHHFLNQEWGWPSLHGPHIDRLGALNGLRVKELRKILFGEKRNLVFKGLRPMNAAARKTKRISGTVTGGNMITSQSTLGTRWQLDAAGKIIFFEEIGERGYKVDRVLEHMRLLKIFKSAKAVIFGPFVGGAEPGGAAKIPAVLSEFAEAMSIPVLRGVRAGHIPNSLSVPFNTPATLLTGRRPELRVATGCAP